MEKLATVVIHFLGDMALLRAGGAIREFAQRNYVLDTPEQKA
jgi:hypothetical protein